MTNMTKLNDDDTPQVEDTGSADDTQDTTEGWDDAFDELYEKPEEADDSEDDESDSEDDSDSDSDLTNDDAEKQDDSEKSDDDKNNSAKEDVVENNGDKEEEKQEEEAPDKQRDAVKEALKEVYNEQKAEEAALQETVSEALSLVRPDGIEDPRVDTDGDKINSPSDVEKLYNPNTGEKFTPSEARDWYEKATKQYEDNLREAQREAIHVARVNKTLQSGREAVMRNYGDFIKENPEIAQRVLARYMSTLKVAGEGENQYIADAPIDILEFYNDVMYPYVELAEKQKEAAERADAEKKAKDEARKRGQAERDESRDFTTNVGEDATKSGEETDWDDAFKQYYGR